MPHAPLGLDFLFRAQKPLALFGGCYLAVVALLLVSPFLQRHLLYLHAVRWPIGADFSTPERYGMAPGRTKQIFITTPSGVRLGAWFTFSEPYYRDKTASIPLSGLTTLPDLNISHALESRPTILYFHGNAASRAVPRRVWAQRSYSSSLGCNVLAVDYRGFADSTGSPTEAGLVEDGVASWDWLTDNGAAPNDIVILGQSLGTAVSVRLGVSLAETGQYARGIVLFAPFSSIMKLLETYSLVGWIPLASPLKSIPYAFELLRYCMQDKWDTEGVIKRVTSPLVVFHARNDPITPVTHSASLFVTLLGDSGQTGKSAEKNEGSVREKRGERVTSVVVEKVGRVQQIYVSGVKATFVEMLWGGHNGIEGYEGALRILQEELHL